MKTRDEMMELFARYSAGAEPHDGDCGALHAEAGKGQQPVPAFDVPDGHTMDTYFEYVCREGFREAAGHCDRHADKGAAASTISPSTRSVWTARSR